MLSVTHAVSCKQQHEKLFLHALKRIVRANADPEEYLMPDKLSR